MSNPDFGKTQLRRIEQYRDRWTTFGEKTGLTSISEKPSAAELKGFELFRSYDDKFLEEISADISMAEWKAGAVLFEEGTYIDLAFFIVSGEIEVFLARTAGTPAPAPIFDPTRTSMGLPEGTVLSAPTAPIPGQSKPRVTRPSAIPFPATMDISMRFDEVRTLKQNDFLGEIGARNGWPQSVTARTKTPCRLLQIRLPALRQMTKKSTALKERIDAIYRERELFAQLKTTPLFQQCGDDRFLDDLTRKVDLVSCEPDEVLVEEGQPVDALYLVRSGFVKLIQKFGEDQMAVSYLSKGMTLGDVELIGTEAGQWEVSARSVEFSELVKISREQVAELLQRCPTVADRLWHSAVSRVKEYRATRRDVKRAELTEIALEDGLVQGNSMLVMDLDVCTRCDDCVRACAATHGGRSRFVREGTKYNNALVAKSCYHCRDPVCMVGCPTGAIHRAGLTEVVKIEDDICIGCGQCAKNCPYDSIMMYDTEQTWPDDMIPAAYRGKPRKVASKCDLCQDTGHGPACVSNCPQNCAYRVGSLEEFEQLLRTRS